MEQLVNKVFEGHLPGRVASFKKLEYEQQSFKVLQDREARLRPDVAIYRRRWLPVAQATGVRAGIPAKSSGCN
jgi:hypothetical protein